MEQDCIFCRIGAGKIPVEAIYDSQEFLAFPDQNPQAPRHILLIPKKHYASLMDVEDAGLLGRAMAAAQQTAQATGLVEEGFRIVVNCGENGGQTVYHLHFHILGGRFMQWPPG